LFQSARGQEAVRSILQVAAHTMKQVLRATDFLGRWEGDQFLALLPLCEENFAEKVGHRLKSTVSGSGIQWWGDRLSVEVGVAATSAMAGDTVETIVTRLHSLLGKNLAGGTQAARGGV
jgi:GGDEF domain-containing protein